jgi:hypothetical protein
MSLEGLVKEIEDARKMEQARWMAMIREQYESTVRAREEEIAALKEEIETLRHWLDHSALPAANPISKRPEALGLIKLNFGRDKPCPDMWNPGEKEVLDSIERDRPDELREPDFPRFPDTPEPVPQEPVPEFSIPEPPKPDRIHLPETEPDERQESGPIQILTGPEQPQDDNIPKQVRAARRIAGLRGSGKGKTRRPTRPRKKAG